MHALSIYHTQCSSTRSTPNRATIPCDSHAGSTPSPTSTSATVRRRRRRSSFAGSAAYSLASGQRTWTSNLSGERGRLHARQRPGGHECRCSKDADEVVTMLSRRKQRRALLHHHTVFGYSRNYMKRPPAQQLRGLEGERGVRLDISSSRFRVCRFLHLYEDVRPELSIRGLCKLSTLLFGHLCHLASDCARPKGSSTLKDIVSIERA